MLGITSIAAAVFAGLSVLVAFFMWRSGTRAQTKEDGRWEGEVKSSLNTFDKKLNTFDKNLNAFDKNLNKFEKRLSRVEDQIAGLYNYLLTIFGPKVIKSESPIVLSELGESISEEIAAQVWADKVSKTLVEEVKGKDSYEIQIFCFQYVEETAEYSDEEQRAIHDSAYKLGIKASDVRRVLAVELRDKLLEHVSLEAPEEAHTNQ